MPKSPPFENMKASQIALLLVGLFAALSLSRASGGGEDVDVDETDVVVLTTKNFDTIVTKSKFALVCSVHYQARLRICLTLLNSLTMARVFSQVEFYAPWWV